MLVCEGNTEYLDAISRLRVIDASTSFPKEEWKELPNIIIIFITEDDVLGYGLPIYHVHRTIEENNQIFDEGSEIIYVNASIQEESALGRLMHDFQCRETKEMHYEFLRKTTILKSSSKL